MKAVRVKPTKPFSSLDFRGRLSFRVAPYAMTFLSPRFLYLAALLVLARPVFADSAAAPTLVSVQALPPVPSDLAASGTVAAAYVFHPALDVALTGPGSADAYLEAPTSCWFGAASLTWEIQAPAALPTNVQVLAFMKDWDYLWYQKLMPGFVQASLTNRFRLDLSPRAGGWEPQGHQGTWHARTLMKPAEFGIRLFTDGAGAFTCRVQNARLEWAPADTNRPWIRDVRATSDRVPCYGRFEVTFSTPDRYPHPFDPAEISVRADIQTPDGRTVSVDGFHARDYYRTLDADGEQTLPQGPPYWRVRFGPTVTGLHRYVLRLRDARGEAVWGPGSFEALPGSLPGHVRVSRRDPRYFEFDNQSVYFPLGHNVRSPSDTRLNSAFPWLQRWTEGTAAYERYFRDMSRHGETFAEVWMAPWSLGLEWSPKWRGYHGVGQYNLMNAWEFDRVLEAAERNGIYLNVVIHNHGKYSTFSDNEWADNPMNAAAGGYLDNPDQFFSHPRAQKDFHNLMRYAIARWGYSTRIFAWQLWSELNLSGTKGEQYKRQEVVDWHRLMARAIKDMDPNDHLVSTHVSGDYTAQNTEIVALPELDHVCVDAYYGGTDPLQIVQLMRSTAEFNNPFGKPVLVSEFGGAWDAQGLTHLENCLHAGLWASTCTPLAGTPMFWWWGLIEEENLYPQYAALSRFMEGVDRRDTNLVFALPAIWNEGAPSVRVLAQCLRTERKAIGWLYNPVMFGNDEPVQPQTISNAVLRVPGPTGGVFRVEYWDTTRGKSALQTNVAARSDGLTLRVPPFVRDWAFKIRPAD